MNVKSSSRVFQLVFFFGYGYIARLSECLSISAVYGESDVEFTCVISPYNGNQQWKIDSTVVAGCGAVSCSEVSTNPARYSFTPNLTSGIFVFNIDSINSTDDKTNVGCSNGTKTKTLAITISDNSHVTDDNGCIIDTMDIIFIVLSSVTRVYAIQILLSYPIYKYVQDELSNEGRCKACVVVISSFPIVGFCPLIILFRSKFFKEVTNEWSWRRKIANIMACVVVILIGGPFVDVIMIYYKYVLNTGAKNIFGILLLCGSFTFIGFIGSSSFILELLNWVRICQDDNGNQLLASLTLHAISIVVLVGSCIFFLAGCQWGFDDLCHQNKVGNGNHSYGIKDDSNL